MQYQIECAGLGQSVDVVKRKIEKMGFRNVTVKAVQEAESWILSLPEGVVPGLGKAIKKWARNWNNFNGHSLYENIIKGSACDIPRKFAMEAHEVITGWFATSTDALEVLQRCVRECLAEVTAANAAAQGKAAT